MQMSGDKNYSQRIKISSTLDAEEYMAYWKKQASHPEDRIQFHRYNKFMLEEDIGYVQNFLFGRICSTEFY